MAAWGCSMWRRKTDHYIDVQQRMANTLTPFGRYGHSLMLSSGVFCIFLFCCCFVLNGRRRFIQINQSILTSVYLSVFCCERNSSITQLQYTIRRCAWRKIMIFLFRTISRDIISRAGWGYPFVTWLFLLTWEIRVFVFLTILSSVRKVWSIHSCLSQSEQ